MKINIEIEITPDEVPLANELISTLRQLTSHVNVKQVSPSDRQAAPSPIYDSAPGMQMLQPGPQVAAPGPSAASAPGGAVGLGALSAAPAKLAAAVPLASSEPPFPISPEVFVPVINRLMDIPALDPAAAQKIFDQVALEIKSLFTHSSSTKEELISAFLQAFTGIVFSPDLVHRQQPLLPFMELLPMLPDSAFSTVRDKLISTVLKHLTIKRKLDADRAEFFAYAEAFAALVKLGTVSISGSITTIITLMNKPENRCAAVTMLGKTCDLCGELLFEKCTEAELAQLRAAVDIIAADTGGPFQYDVDYIKSIMG
mmetsp:Transcript_8135/g.23343  ORF Transcript_8135/g.23343 Transcript_8135/m.23343 type:complete len:314 (-) Transcript_8135:57-998(-)